MYVHDILRVSGRHQLERHACPWVGISFPQCMKYDYSLDRDRMRDSRRYSQEYGSSEKQKRHTTDGRLAMMNDHFHGKRRLPRNNSLEDMHHEQLYHNQRKVQGKQTAVSKIAQITYTY